MNVRLQPPRSEIRTPGISIPTSALTLDGFRAWVKSPEFPDQGVQVSFLGEEVHIDMAPKFYDTHNAIKTELYGLLRPLVRRLGLGRLFTDRMLYTNIRADISTEPDCMFAAWGTWHARRVELAPSPSGTPNYELVGTPDMVVEIVSNSSVGKDLRSLRSKYHLAGIPEYWVIDARGDEIAFVILRYTAEEYVSLSADDGGWLRSAVFDRDFRLSRERDQLGDWDYTLHVRPEVG